MPGDQPVQDAQVFKVRSVSGGVNNKSFPLDIGDEQSVELENISTDIPGLRQRRGPINLTATGITLGPILAMEYFDPSFGNEDPMILAVALGGSAGDHRTLWRYQGDSDLFELVGTLTGYTSQNAINIIVGYDVNVTGGHIALINTSEPVDRWYYNGTDLYQASFGSVAPGSNIGTFFNGRALIKGVDSRRSSVFVSDIYSFTVTGWDNPDFRRFDFADGRGNDIRQIKGFREEQAIIYMDNRIEVLFMTESGTTAVAAALDSGSAGSFRETFSRRTIHTSIGCGSAETVQNVGEDQIFMDQYGNIRSLQRTITDASQGVRSIPISDPIQGYIDRITQSSIGTSVAIAHRDRYFVALPLDGDGFPNYIFVYDPARRAWDGPHTGHQVKEFAEGALTGATDPRDRKNQIYIGNSTSNPGTVKTFRPEPKDSLEFEEVVTLRETTKRFDFGAFESDKIWYRLEVLAVATEDVDLVVEASVDAAPFVTIGSINLLGGSADIDFPEDLPYELSDSTVVAEKLSLESLPRGRDIQYRLTVTSSEEVKILGHHTFAWIEKANYEVTTSQQATC